MLELKVDFCGLKPQDVAKRIDHALLKPWTTIKDLEKAINELEELNLRCLIVTPTHLEKALELTTRCVGVVVGFPYGYHTLEAKIKEIEDVIAMGAKEVDFVANLQLLLANRKDEYINEIKALTTICKASKVTCKVIIEATALPRDMLADVVRSIARLKDPPNYIKTSSGFGPRPTYFEDVVIIDNVLVREGKRNVIGIKAAGGIREWAHAILMLSAGADIIGTSTPKQIIEGYYKVCK